MDRRQPVTLEEIEVHDRFVRDLARRLLAEDVHGAEDLAQDVWSAALERPPEHRGSLRGWLRAVTLALNSSRLRRGVLLYDAAIDSRARSEPHSAEQVELAAQRRAVARAVNDLREPYREVILLRFYEALPPREVARRLGRPVETVHTQTKRGLAQVRQALQKDKEGDIRSWLLLLAAHPRPPELQRLALPAACAAGVAGVVISLQLAAPAEPPLALAPAAAPASATDEPPARGSREVPPDPARREPQAAQPAGSSSEQPARSAQRFSARIEDGVGRGIGGAVLLVKREEGWVERARANESGEVELEVEPEDLGTGVAPDGFLWIKAQAAGWATAQEAVVDVGGRERAHARLELQPSGAALRGRVLDPDSIPVPDARVLVLPVSLPTGSFAEGALYRTARHETRTDEDGAFELEHLAQGRAQVFLQHDELGIGRCQAAIALGAPSVELEFTPGSIVRGVVLGEDGAPAAGAAVSGIAPGPVNLPTDWTETRADGAGRFALSMTADARLELWARAEGALDVLASEVVAARPGEQIEWSPRLRRWPPVRVRVVDRSGAPVPDWLVSLISERAGETRWSVGQTDAQGLAEMFLPVEGTLQLRVHGPLAGERDTSVAIQGGVSPSDELVHEIAVDRERGGVGGLTARVVARSFELPLELLVMVEQAGVANQVRVSVDSEGGLRAAGLAAGRYLLTVIGPGALRCSLGVGEVSAGAIADLGELELQPPGRLDLSRVPADPPLELWLEREEGDPLLCWSGRGGSAEPLLLFPGRYVLDRPPGVGDPTELHIELLPAGLVEVKGDLTLHSSPRGN